MPFAEISGRRNLRILDDDLRKLSGAQRIQPKVRRNATRCINVGTTECAIGLRDHSGMSAVSLLADSNIERKLRQQFDAVLFRHFAAAPGAEDVLFVSTVRTDMRAHVLDDA